MSCKLIILCYNVAIDLLIAWVAKLTFKLLTELLSKHELYSPTIKRIQFIFNIKFYF